MGIWQYCFSNHSFQLKVSPHLVSRYRSCVRRQSYRGPSEAVADRVEEIWIRLLKSKPGVEVRKHLSIKSSLLFWQNLGSLNTSYSGSTSSEGGGGGTLRMKAVRMLVVSLRGVNFGFWSHLRCSGQNAIIFSREGLV